MKKLDRFRISVVLNTADRAEYLGDTLKGLEQQTYDDFEVIVVNGPSQDNTEEVAKKFNVRYYTAPYNLSVSRNIGIKHAAGDIVAFIDDDAVPSPTWLEEIALAYNDEAVGAAGGWVYHVDSADYQFKYGAISKWGVPLLKTVKDFDYNEPHGHFYNINIGTNATYRRDYLVSVGGFDEEIEYYHDESDVCVRIINAGYKVVELEGAIVHHKMAPSSRRKTWRNVTNWDSVVKNGVYFAVKHSKGVAPLPKRIVKPFLVHKEKIKLVWKAAISGDLSPWLFLYRTVSLLGAFAKGYWRGFFNEQKLLTGYKYTPASFKKYKTATRKTTPFSTIAVTSQGFPPTATDGIARYNHTLAKELASRGYEVHVFTKSTESLRGIRYMDGMWVHYYDTSSFSLSLTGHERVDNVVALNKALYRAIEDFSHTQPIDILLSPLWDVEGLGLGIQKIAPVIVTLMSPLKKVVETQWSHSSDPGIEVMYELEEHYIRNADGVMAISSAILKTIGEGYEIDWESLGVPVEVIPLGVEPTLAAGSNHEKKRSSSIELLYVGRFEERKGIDLLLKTLPSLLETNKDLSVRLVGNSDIPDESGKFIYKDFLKHHRKAPWLSRIRHDGYVSDSELANAYKDCDIFVAPSRYESFGLIFVEAMANAKPVIGTDIGGIPEIITDGVNGFLFEKEDTKQLQNAIQKLVDDPKLRLQMGEAGKRMIQEKFTSDRMVDAFEKLAAKILNQRPKAN